MAELGHKVRRKEVWLPVSTYAKKHGIKHPESLYVKMLKNQVKWREVEIVIKRKEILDE